MFVQVRVEKYRGVARGDISREFLYAFHNVVQRRPGVVELTRFKVVLERVCQKWSVQSLGVTLGDGQQRRSSGLLKQQLTQKSDIPIWAIMVASSDGVPEDSVEEV